MENIWPEIVIAFLTALLSWIVNRATIVAELKKAKREKINEEQLPLYIECYELLERNIANANIVFENEYIENLIHIKSKMKLIASNNVLQAFKSYYKWATTIYKEYLIFYQEHDPSSRVSTGITDSEEEYEVCHFNEHDLEVFKLQINKYIAERGIKHTTINSKTQEILNSMRSELGNNIFQDNFICD